MKALFQILFLSLFFLSCTKNPNTSSASEINLAIWGNYLAPEVQKKFTDTTGIRINVTNYSSNEELLAKIQMGSSGIDMAVPSDYMVDIMTKLDLLENLDRNQLPNFKNISSRLLKQSFDPENKHSVPYAWTTAGIAVNRDLYKGKINGWKDVLENSELAGKFSLLDDLREVIGMALKLDGKSVNTKSTEDLKKAEARLLKIKKNVKTFTSDTLEVLKNKEVMAAQAYSVDALQAAAQGSSKIEYIIPEEGGTRSIDTMVVFKGAKNKDNAHKLINFLLEKENSLVFVKNIKSGPVLEGVKELLPKELKDNPALFPSTQVMSRLEGIVDLGETNRTYEKIWEQIKTH